MRPNRIGRRFSQSASQLPVAAGSLCFSFGSIYQAPRASDVTQRVKPLEQKDMIRWGEICTFQSHYAPLKVLQNCYSAIKLTGSRAETATKYDCILWQACSKAADGSSVRSKAAGHQEKTVR